jgi:hypothetical protein
MHGVLSYQLRKRKYTGCNFVSTPIHKRRCPKPEISQKELVKISNTADRKKSLLLCHNLLAFTSVPDPDP